MAVADRSVGQSYANENIPDATSRRAGVRATILDPEIAVMQNLAQGHKVIRRRARVGLNIPEPSAWVVCVATATFQGREPNTLQRDGGWLERVVKTREHLGYGHTPPQRHR